MKRRDGYQRMGIQSHLLGELKRKPLFRGKDLVIEVSMDNLAVLGTLLRGRMFQHLVQNKTFLLPKLVCPNLSKLQNKYVFWHTFVFMFKVIS